MPDKPESLTIHYEEPARKPTLAVSGAYGGVSPDGGLVVAHLYTEWGMVPSFQEIARGEDGEFRGTDATLIKRGDILREVQATILLTPEQAMSIGKWLIEKGYRAREARAQRAEPDVTIEPGESDEEGG